MAGKYERVRQSMTAIHWPACIRSTIRVTDRMNAMQFSYAAIQIRVRALDEATDRLVRFDERLARAHSALAAGVKARADLADSQAVLHLSGRLASMEDLVLHDAAMDRRAPGPDLLRAASYLDLRRTLSRRNPDAALSQAGLAAITGGGGDGAQPEKTSARAVVGKPWRMPGDDDPDSSIEDEIDADPEDDVDGREEIEEAGADHFAAIDRILARSRRALTDYNDLGSSVGQAALRLSDPAYDEAGRLARWLAALGETAEMPAVAAAAAALDAWLALDPSEHRGEIGFLLAAMVLRQRRRARAHLPALALGMRRGKFRWRPHDPPSARLNGLIEAIAAAAEAGADDLDRLSLARAAMLQRCADKQKNSRLPELIDLFIGSPLVTIAMAAKKLNVSSQSIEAMMKDLGGAVPRELTGRKRYRAWGIV